MNYSKYLLITILSLLFSACGHFEQEAAEVNNVGDKYYGVREKVKKSSDRIHIEPLKPRTPDFIPSKIVTNYALDNAPIQKKAENVPKPNKTGTDENGVFLYHEVKNGETVYMLSRRYKISPRKIIRNNNLKEPYELIIGDVIKIHSALAVARIKNAAESKRNDEPHESAISQEIQEKIDTAENKIIVPEKKEKSSPKRRILPNKKYNDKKYIWPVKGKIISKFGVQSSGIKNDGIIIAAKKGTEILAVKSGEVVYAGDDIADFGNMVIIKHRDNIFTTYAHQDQILVNKGDIINQGDVIGFVGSSGSVKSPCLYFSIRKGKKLLNPSKILG